MPDLTPQSEREPIKPPTGTDCPPSLGMVPAIVRNAARDQSESLPAIVGIRNWSLPDEIYSMSAMLRLRRPAARMRPVAMGQKATLRQQSHLALARENLTTLAHF